MTKKAAFVFIALIFCLALPLRLHALDVGDPAKDFALPDAGGNMVTLHETARGAPATILEFLSVYCQACRKKAPAMNRIATKYAPKGVRVLAVALANDQQDAAGIIKDWDLKFPVIPDPEKKTYYLYRISKVPQIFIIDDSDVIRYKGNGDDEEAMEKTLEGLIADKKNSGDAVTPGDKAPAISLVNLSGQTAAIQIGGDAENNILAFLSPSDSVNRDLVRMLCSIAGKRLTGVRVQAVLPGSMEKTGAGLASLCSGLTILVDRQGAAFEKYGVTRAPEIMILSRSGRVRAREAPQTLQELAGIVQPSAAAKSAFSEKQLSEYLRQSMPGASSIRPIRLGDKETIYIGDTSQGKRLARVVKKDILCEVCTDVFYIMTIDSNGNIVNITLVKPFELYGKPIDATRFTSQFIGKSFREHFTAGVNADSITGATKSCMKFIEGLNETGATLSSLKKPPFDAAFRETVCYLNQSEVETALQRYQQDHAGKSTMKIKHLVPLCPQGRLPQCPEQGEYRIVNFNGIGRALCTVHGLDPRSSMIH